MAEVINGDFKRLSPRRGKRPKKRRERGLADSSGSIGTDLWEYFNPDLVQEENVALTGTNYNPDDGDAYQVMSLSDQLAAAVAKLDAASAALDAAESNLLAIQAEVFASGTASDQAAWTTNYNKIIAAQSTRDAALDTVHTVGGWVDNVKSSLGLNGLGGMGVLPAIPWSLVAGIVASAAAIYAIANAANIFFNQWQINKWNAENIRRQNANEPLLTGNPALADTGGGIGGIFGDTATIAKYAMWGLLAFFLLPPALKMLEHK